MIVKKLIIECSNSGQRASFKLATQDLMAKYLLIRGDKKGFKLNTNIASDNREFQEAIRNWFDTMVDLDVNLKEITIRTLDEPSGMWSRMRSKGGIKDDSMQEFSRVFDVAKASRQQPPTKEDNLKSDGSTAIERPESSSLERRIQPPPPPRLRGIAVAQTNFSQTVPSGIASDVSISLNNASAPMKSPPPPPPRELGIVQAKIKEFETQLESKSLDLNQLQIDLQKVSGDLSTAEQQLLKANATLEEKKQAYLTTRGIAWSIDRRQELKTRQETLERTAILLVTVEQQATVAYEKATMLLDRKPPAATNLIDYMPVFFKNARAKIDELTNSKQKLDESNQALAKVYYNPFAAIYVFLVNRIMGWKLETTYAMSQRTIITNRDSIEQSTVRIKELNEAIIQLTEFDLKITECKNQRSQLQTLNDELKQCNDIALACAAVGVDGPLQNNVNTQKEKKVKYQLDVDNLCQIVCDLNAKIACETARVVQIRTDYDNKYPRVSPVEPVRVVEQAVGEVHTTPSMLSVEVKLGTSSPTSSSNSDEAVTSEETGSDNPRTPCSAGDEIASNETGEVLSRLKDRSFSSSAEHLVDAAKTPRRDELMRSIQNVSSAFFKKSARAVNKTLQIVRWQIPTIETILESKHQNTIFVYVKHRDNLLRYAYAAEGEVVRGNFTSEHDGIKMKLASQSVEGAALLSVDLTAIGEHLSKQMSLSIFISKKIDSSLDQVPLKSRLYLKMLSTNDETAEENYSAADESDDETFGWEL